MKNIFGLAILLGVLALVSCQEFGQKKGPVFQIENRFTVKNHCVNDDQCATFNVGIQQLSGGDSLARHNITWDMQKNLLMIIRNDVNKPYEVAMDSLGNRYLQVFIQKKRDDPKGFTDQWMTQFLPNVMLNNSKVLTVSENILIALGKTNETFQAHTIATYEVKAGKRLGFKDLVTDSTAVLPLIEKELRKTVGLAPDADLGQKFMLTEGSLPYPHNIGIVPEGLACTYNMYEIAFNDGNLHDLIISWEALGKLADRKKWLD